LAKLRYGSPRLIATLETHNVTHRIQAFQAVKRLITTLPFMCLLADRLRLLFLFNFRYLDEDQTLLWYASSLIDAAVKQYNDKYKVTVKFKVANVRIYANLRDYGINNPDGAEQVLPVP
jgi:hypothetical protein